MTRPRTTLVSKRHSGRLQTMGGGSGYSKDLCLNLLTTILQNWPSWPVFGIFAIALVSYPIPGIATPPAPDWRDDTTTAESFQRDQAFLNWARAAVGDAVATAERQPIAHISQVAVHTDPAATVFYELGQTHLQQGQYEQALEAFNRYILLIQRSAGPLEAAKALQDLARTYSNATDSAIFDLVTGFAQRALAIYQDLNVLDLQVETLRNLAYAYSRQQLYRQAFEFQRQALDLASQVEDRDRQASLLSKLTRTTHSQFHSRTEMVLQLEQHMLQIYQGLGDRHEEAKSLSRIGNIYHSAGQFKEALDFFQQAYGIYEELGDLEWQATILSALGNLYMVRGVFYRYADTECLRQDQYDQALHFYQQALDRHQRLVDQTAAPEQQREQRLHLAHRLDEIASASSNFACQHDQAITFYQNALSLYRQLGDHHAAAQTLQNLGREALFAQRHEQAMVFHQQALEAYQALAPDRITPYLIELRYLYANHGDGEQAIQFGQAIVASARASENRREEASALQGLGKTYELVATNRRWSDIRTRLPDGTPAEQEAIFNQPPLPEYYIVGFEQAIATYQQALTIYQDLQEPLWERGALFDLGDAYDALQQPEAATAFFQQALALERQRGTPAGEAQVLERLGERYFHQADYSAAIAAFQTALAIYQTLNYPSGAASMLSWLGTTHRKLGEYAPALSFYQRAYDLYQALDQTAIASWKLKDMGEMALALEQPQAALGYFRQAVELHQATGDVRAEQQILGEIGHLYLKRGNLQLALTFHEPYLASVTAQGDRLEAVNRLNHFGRYYQWHGQTEQALVFFQQALVHSYQLQADPDFASFDGSGHALSGIGNLLVEQEQPALAIAFYKAAVNRYEAIRASFRASFRTRAEASEIISDTDFANLFLDKQVETYRALAALLLQQDRVVEAQRVLDLLKVQELDDYLRGIQRTSDTQTGVDYLRPEASILARYDTLQQSAISAGQELANLKAIPAAERSQPQSQRIAQLTDLLDEINADFRSFARSPEIRTLVDQLSFDAQEASLSLNQLDRLRNELSQLNAAIIYPLILADRLELVITTPDAPPLRRTVPVSREAFNQMILTFRTALTSADPAIEESAQQLYDWLIRPLEPDLTAAGVDTLIYAPDGQLRYIPLAALHDGEQWLIQRYQINNITAASLTNLTETDAAQPRILAAAYADATLVHTPVVNGKTYTFQGLPGAGQEVAALPTAVTLLDKDFSLATVRPIMDEYTVLHFATHAAFVTGDPEDSFILFGNGDTPTLRDIASWSLNGVDLVVLSACETGVGGLGDGEEILGMGYQFQLSGAKAVMSSLWQVSDRGTQHLMQAFYDALEQGMTKAAALQAAQMTLITGNLPDEVATTETETNDAETGAERSIRVVPHDGEPTPRVSHYSHPYYWAAFILIGNGL